MLVKGSLTPVGSGLEVELSSTLPDESDKEDQEFRVPGRKSLEVSRYQNEGSELEIEVFDSTAQRTSGSFKSSFLILLAMDFPRVEMEETDLRVSLPSMESRTRLEQVARWWRQTGNDLRRWIMKLRCHGITRQWFRAKQYKKYTGY